MSRNKKTNLKHKLLIAAKKRINEGGIEALSLRKLAVDAGVTTMATYHHYANKKALLIDVSIHGFNALYDSIRKRLDKSDSSVVAVKKIMIGYYKFVQENSNLYHLMFSYEMSEARHTIPEFIKAAQKGLYLVADTIKAHMDKHGHILDREAAGECFWAILHGRVCTEHDGSVLDDIREDAPIKDLIDETIRNIFHLTEDLTSNP